jgi:hypothetical protein
VCVCARARAHPRVCARARVCRCGVRACVCMHALGCARVRACVRACGSCVFVYSRRHACVRVRAGTKSGRSMIEPTLSPSFARPSASPSAPPSAPPTARLERSVRAPGRCAAGACGGLAPVRPRVETAGGCGARPGREDAAEPNDCASCGADKANAKAQRVGCRGPCGSHALADGAGAQSSASAQANIGARKQTDTRAKQTNARASKRAGSQVRERGRAESDSQVTSRTAAAYGACGTGTEPTRANNTKQTKKPPSPERASARAAQGDGRERARARGTDSAVRARGARGRGRDRLIGRRLRALRERARRPRRV